MFNYKTKVHTTKGTLMAKTNYSYEKRGRELEKQKKQEEKRQKKLNKKNDDNKEEELESRPSSDNPLEKQTSYEDLDLSSIIFRLSQDGGL